MDILNTINSIQIPGFLQTVTSPEALSKVSALPSHYLMYGMAGLMFLRFFGGMFFSILSLVSLVLGTITSLLCGLCAMLVKLFGSAAQTCIQIIGDLGVGIIASPRGLFKIMFSRRILVPVTVSVAAACLYLKLTPSNAHAAVPAGWEAIEEAATYEAF